MLNDAQTRRMLGKLTRYEQTLESRIFDKIGEIEVKRFETREQYRSVPSDDNLFIPTQKGDTWGSEGTSCWFKGKVKVPDEYRGRKIFVNPLVGGVEALFFINGIPSGIFTNKNKKTSVGDHYNDLLTANADPEKEINVAIEVYAGHIILGTQPLESNPVPDFKYTFEGVYLTTKNQDIADFIFDLRTLNGIVEKLDNSSFRKAEIINCLAEIHKTVYYAIEDTDESIWRPALARARKLMEPVLNRKNSGTVPFAGILGHSHMDTAWLWPLDETIRKCARTYSNQVSLMEQFPEYRFIQSSSYHDEMIRLNYPELFEKIKEKVLEGRYEPNGGVWVECDCNITSGESMVRQFLWGQKYTQKHFNFTSNIFWLPDTFGYSAAIPQIMKGCRVDYFMTTKISWNDTNKFPYETFYWVGIDGTPVFTHFNTIHCWPEPKVMIEQLNHLQNKSVAKSRLLAYGYGDGGGGPLYEMIEMSKRVKDLEGCPKSEHVNAGEFMIQLEKEAVNPPVYKGELYLELHRGTLTSHHNIKRNNRKLEYAIHDLELLTVQKAVTEGVAAEDGDIRPLLNTLLVNQFHDILPGTSISRVNDQCYSEMGTALDTAASLIENLISAQNDDDAVTIINTLGFERSEVIYLKDCTDKHPENKEILAQLIKAMDGNEQLSLANVTLPAFGSKVVKLSKGSAAYSSTPFKYETDVLTTPFAKITFDDSGTIKSFVDTRVNRELRGKGLPLNTFLFGEDLPSAWDNWDIDVDLFQKLEPVAKLVERQVVADGAVQFRIRSKYQLSEKSSVIQDMIFYSTTPRVDFETIIDWNDKHRFFKVDFDTTILSNSARHEIQFGHSQKPTTRNTSVEQAMFEVVNHKFTDISETRYGIALLNDCKYGISVEGSDMRLSLHKGGCRPDPRGDAGVHKCTYSFMPHIGEFSADNVVKPAYSLNVKPIVKVGRGEYKSFAWVDSSNIMIETIKPCEESQKAFIIRLYEAEGTFTHTNLKLGIDIKKAELTNMLEETLEELGTSGNIPLTFRPFEIKTLKILY